ncbi:hypothetical protein [Adhaeretor mobilis]|uniref:Uncharacterized protein n=1 Tax=Adhaeretor mobilis TaxID=1930276 RepID=A0A517MUP2_9BACT|nr:hypothetical protein [Adhaeretor mobilis]QDS98590.1 hypothetical protein HG15A2_18710 [Adhaeretor mobilis]
MSKSLAIHLSDDQATVAVVETSGDLPKVDAASTVHFSASDLETRGNELSAAIENCGGHRLRAVVMFSRADLHWQNYQFPPAPVEDLPDLVSLQAMRDHPLAGAEKGFDFLPLEGDADNPHRVLGISVDQKTLDKTLELCEEANVRIAHLTARPLGWASLLSTDDRGAAVHAAVENDSATMWATQDGQITRLRALPLPSATAAESRAKLLAGELQRTAMTLQPKGESPATITAWFDFSTPEARSVAEFLPENIQRGDIASRLDISDTELNLQEIAPLAGLATQRARGQQPPLDLLNPRRPVAPPSKGRTWALAGVAAAALAAMVGYQAYQNVNAPLRAAETAEAEQAVYQATLEELASDQQQHAKVSEWNENTVNLLDELDALSQQLRPVPLDSEAYPKDKDVLTGELSLLGDEWTLTAAVPNDSAVQPLEDRLRKEGRRVTRQSLTKDDSINKAYPLKVVEKIQLANDSTESQP